MALVEAVPAQLAIPSFDGVFPLPLSTFETLMFSDARPGYPMLIDFELRLGGCIDRAAFDKALTFALARNPLFTCLIRRQGSHALAWVPSDLRPPVDWAPPEAPVAGGHGAPIDLTREIGLKIWVRAAAERSTVLFHFHHACCDGVGFYAFIEDLMAGYTMALPGAAPVAPRPLEPERLKQRGLIGVPRRNLLQRIYDSWAGTREGFRFWAEAPLPLPPQCEPAAGSGQAIFLTQSIDREVVTGLRLAAEKVGATRYDVLVRDLLLTLRRWHDAAGHPLPRRRLRVLVPQNLREADDARLPACNAVSFGFITRKGVDCERPRELLESIAREMEQLRRWKLSLYFLGGLASLTANGLLPWVLRRRACFATAVLSNLGDPTRNFSAQFPKAERGIVVGNLVFEGLVGCPPVRPLTRASLGVALANGIMTVCLKCDPLCYSPEDVRRLLGEYVVQLQATAAAALSAGPARAPEIPADAAIQVPRS